MPDFIDFSDVLNLSTVLRRASVNRAFFDPTNKKHLESFDTFLKTGNWGSVQFFCEQPYTDVPMTVLMKFAMHKQKVQRESTLELTKRMAAKFPKKEEAVNEEAVD